MRLSVNLYQKLLGSALDAGISFSYDPPKATNNIISPENLAALRYELATVKHQRDELGKKLASLQVKMDLAAATAKGVWTQHEKQFAEQKDEMERLQKARECSDEDKDNLIAELRREIAKLNGI